MHAEIIHQLSKMRNVSVIAREAVLQNVNKSLAERASDLGVESILTGTFQYVDGRIRVNMQLVDPASNRNLWAHDYEAPFEDVFAVQADVAARVAAALGAELTVAERQRMEIRPTTSGEAYAIYLLALNHENSGRRFDALSQFERAVEIDPTFSLAYGKLALLYALALIDMTSGPAASIAPSELERRSVGQRTDGVESRSGFGRRVYRARKSERAALAMGRGGGRFRFGIDVESQRSRGALFLFSLPNVTRPISRSDTDGGADSRAQSACVECGIALQPLACARVFRQRRRGSSAFSTRRWPSIPRKYPRGSISVS